MKKTKQIKLMALLLSLLMVLSSLALFALPSSAITADSGWYSSSASVLYVENAADLWAFASALQSGKTFSGQTVKLTDDITVNKGWDAFASSVSQPTDIWPLKTTNKHFAGTFDGQGHTLSGLYASTNGTAGFGFFGDVATGTSAAVKNLTIVNSYILNTDGSVTGGIFGEIEVETNELIKDDYRENVTRGEIDNVHLSIRIDVRGIKGGSTSGVGGFVGCSRADLVIKNSSFDGKIQTGARGVAAFLGATYPKQISGLDHDSDGATTAFYPKDGNLANTEQWDINGDGVIDTKDAPTYYKNNTPKAGNEGTAPVSANAYKTYTTIENCKNTGTIDVSIEGANRFAGALVGYTNSNAETITVRNFVSTGRFVGVSVANNPIGYLIGGSWVTTNNHRNVNTTESQVWVLENVYVKQTSGDAYANVGRIANGMQFVGAERSIEQLKDYLKDSMAQSITLKNDLSLNIYATILDPDAVVTINGERVEGVSVSGWTKCYEVSGLLPQQMADSVKIHIVQMIDGERVEVFKNTSILKYCLDFFHSERATDVEKDLIADLLRYGKQAQLYSKYNTSLLPTDKIDLSDFGNSFDKKDIPSYFNRSGVLDEKYDINAAALMLGNSLAMYLRFVAEDTNGLTMTVSINGRTKVYVASDFVSLGGGQYMVSHENIGAHEMNLPLTAVLKQDGEQIGQQLTCSIADYVGRFLASDVPDVDDPVVTPGISLKPGTEGDSYEDTRLLEQMALVSAMYTYGLSAEAYNDSTRRVIVDGTTSEYVIVYDNSASSEIVQTAHKLADAIAVKTGVKLAVVDDTTAQTAKEIIVGSVDGRSASTSVMAQMTSAGKNGYRISLVDEKVVIATNHKHQLSYAVERFVDALSTHGGASWSVSLDYCEIVDVPSYTAPSGTTLKVYDAGNHNYTWSYTSTTSNLANEYEQYISLLESQGFVKYTTNSINNCSFSTYTKTTDGYNTVVYTMHYPNTKNFRITYGPLKYLPGLEPISGMDVGPVADPQIIFNARETLYRGSCGMSMIFQLVDGSFIVVDGGNSDGTAVTKSKVDGVWVENEPTQTNDAKVFYELLCDLTPGDEKPVISAWFITHADGDHIDFPVYFLPLYHDKVDVKMLVHNSPDYEFASMSWNEQNGGNRAAYLKKVNSLIASMENYYPDSVVWDCHTGQKLQLPECEIEIWYTPEDYYGDKNNTTSYVFTSANEACICFRMTIGGQTIMMLGDSGWTILERMANNYGSACESDILQISHHGSNGGNYPFYALVDPKICLWAVHDEGFETGEYQLGNKNGTQTGNSYLYANWWVRNTEWTRADGTHGARDHYCTAWDEHRFIPLGSYDSEGLPVITPSMPLK